MSYVKLFKRAGEELKLLTTVEEIRQFLELDDSYNFYLSFPSQTGNAGKYLTTDGTNLSWATVSTSDTHIGNANLTLTGNRTLELDTYTFGIKKGANTNFHVFNNGRIWMGNGTPTDNGFQSEVNGSSRWTAGSHRIRGATTGANLTLRIENSAGTIVADFYDNQFVSIPSLTVTTVDAGSLSLSLQSSIKTSSPAVQARFSSSISDTGTSTIFATRQASFFCTGSNVYNLIAFRANDQMSNFGGGGILNYTGFYFDPGAEVNAGTRNYIAFRNDKGDNLLNTASGATVFGATSVNASALVEMVSTTKGFLPPRMTGAQAEAITTPAAGLLVYINNGNGATITTTGWWGYDGTTWVKLN